MRGPEKDRRDQFAFDPSKLQTRITTEDNYIIIIIMQKMDNGSLDGVGGVTARGRVTQVTHMAQE